MGMLSNAFLHWEIRTLEGRDPKVPFKSMVFIKADGEGSRGAGDRHLGSLSCTTERDTISSASTQTENLPRRALSRQMHTCGRGAFVAHDAWSG